MARNAIPKYRRHASGQARVTLTGKTFYLGKWGSPSSKLEYDKLVAEWIQNGRSWPGDVEQTSDERAQIVSFSDDKSQVLLADICAGFLQHCSQRVKSTKRRTSATLSTARTTVRALKPWYAITCHEFGPRRLKEFRSTLIEAGKSRVGINRCCAMVKTMFKWAVSEDLIAGEAKGASFVKVAVCEWPLTPLGGRSLLARGLLSVAWLAVVRAEDLLTRYCELTFALRRVDAARPHFTPTKTCKARP